MVILQIRRRRHRFATHRCTLRWLCSPSLEVQPSLESETGVNWKSVVDGRVGRVSLTAVSRWRRAFTKLAVGS